VADHGLADLAERAHLLGGQQIDQVPADGRDVIRRGAPDRVQSLLGDDHERPARVGGAVGAADQSALLHAADVVGQPARRPLHVGGQFGQPAAQIGGLGQRGQHLVVRHGQPAVAVQLAGDLGVDEQHHAAVRAPRPLLLVGEPVGHDAILPFS